MSFIKNKNEIKLNLFTEFHSFPIVVKYNILQPEWNEKEGQERMYNRQHRLLYK